MTMNVPKLIGEGRIEGDEDRGTFDYQYDYQLDSSRVGYTVYFIVGICIMTICRWSLLAGGLTVVLVVGCARACTPGIIHVTITWRAGDYGSCCEHVGETVGGINTMECGEVDT